MRTEQYATLTVASLVAATLSLSLPAHAASLLATENTSKPAGTEDTRNVNIYRIIIDGNSCFATLLDTRAESVIPNTNSSPEVSTDNFNGNAFDPQSCFFYYSRYDREENLVGDDPNPFFFYDVLDGGTQRIADLQNGAAGAAIYDGAYYYIPQRSRELRKVTFASNGTVVAEESVCQIPSSSLGGGTLAFGDIAFDPLDSMTPPALYGSATRIGSQNKPQFFRIDGLNCDTYTVLSEADTFGAGALQIAFGLSDGILYGHSARTGDFFTINTSTGVQSLTCSKINKNDGNQVQPTGDFGGIDSTYLKLADLTEGQCASEVFDGCTPGYWKQKHHEDSWEIYGYADLFGDVFGVEPSIEGITLQEAVKLGGGGENALLRHAVAALLNASSSGVDYAYLQGQVIAIVQDAYASGEFEEAKDLLESANESICPLS